MLLKGGSSPASQAVSKGTGPGHKRWHSGSPTWNRWPPFDLYTEKLFTFLGIFLRSAPCPHLVCVRVCAGPHVFKAEKGCRACVCMGVQRCWPCCVRGEGVGACAGVGRWTKGAGAGRESGVPGGGGDEVGRVWGGGTVLEGRGVCLRIREKEALEVGEMA